jgi:hypothetical protein
MTKSEPTFTRGQLRVWLKWVIQSGLLDRLSPQYDRGDELTPEPTEAVARRLLSALQVPELSRTDLLEIAAEVAEFRSWVEVQRKASLKTILAEVELERVNLLRPERRGASMPRGQEPNDRRRPPPARALRSDPMWDEHLDG